MHTDASMFVFWNTLYCYAQMEKVETQNFASHKEERHLFSAYSPHAYIAMDCSGDAKFCVSTGLAPSL